MAMPIMAGPIHVQATRVHRRLRSARAAATALVVVVGAFVAVALAGQPVTATPPATYRPLPDTALLAVPLPSASSLRDLGTPGGAVNVSAGPSANETAGSVADVEARHAPGIVRFRPVAGQTGVSRFAQVSVRFSEPMDRASTQRAFSANADGSAVTGHYHWAEGDTVLVLVPADPLPYDATVRLAVADSARSADGRELERSGSVAFSVTHRPAPTPTPLPVHRATPAPTHRATSTTSTTGWRWPLIGPITQYFGQTLTKYGFHQGIDIDGQTGDPVRAAHSGTVIVAGHYDSCGGNEVHIDHGGGVESWYRHLSVISVHVGEHVSAGTLVGKVGATGCALGSHLHFAIRVNGTFVDPLRYLPRR